MSQKIVQINFKFNVSRAEYEEAVTPVAEEIAAVNGLRWKVWLMNEAEQLAGGIYVFDDEEAANAYLEGPIVAATVKHPALSDFDVKVFDAIDGLSKVTRGLP